MSHTSAAEGERDLHEEFEPFRFAKLDEEFEPTCLVELVTIHYTIIGHMRSER